MLLYLSTETKYSWCFQLNFTTLQSGSFHSVTPSCYRVGILITGNIVNLTFRPERLALRDQNCVLLIWSGSCAAAPWYMEKRLILTAENYCNVLEAYPACYPCMEFDQITQHWNINASVIQQHALWKPVTNPRILVGRKEGDGGGGGGCYGRGGGVNIGGPSGSAEVSIG